VRWLRRCLECRVSGAPWRPRGTVTQVTAQKYGPRVTCQVHGQSRFFSERAPCRCMATGHGSNAGAWPVHGPHAGRRARWPNGLGGTICKFPYCSSFSGQGLHVRPRALHTGHWPQIRRAPGAVTKRARRTICVFPPALALAMVPLAQWLTRGPPPVYGECMCKRQGHFAPAGNTGHLPHSTGKCMCATQ